jgi:hypothetical protein
MQINLPKFKEIDWIRTLALVFSILAFSSALWNWYNPRQQASTKPEVMPESTKVVDVPKITLKGPKTIEVYDKGKLDRKIPLPPEIKGDKNAQPTATADIKPSQYGGTAVSFTNLSTGKSGIVYQAKPVPFFEFKNVRELSVDYGITTKGIQHGTLGARWTFLRTGIVNWHGRGEISTEPEAKVFLGVHAEF